MSTWTIPTTRASGDLITSSIWNTDLVENLKYLKDAGVSLQGVAGGRLTLTTATPVTTSDVTGATTLYYTPYTGSQIALYDGSSTWTVLSFSELSLSLAGYTASRPYDIWAYNNSGTVALESTVWTSATARATALAYQNGVLVKSGTTTRRYLGTIYINSSGGQTDDTYRIRSVFNNDNRVNRAVRVFDTTSNWSYATATWRQARATTTNQITVMQGVAEEGISLSGQCSWTSDSGANRGAISIGEDSTTTPATTATYGSSFNPSTNLLEPITTQYSTIPAVGLHTYVWLEHGGGLTGVGAFFGTYSATGGIAQSGITGTWRA